MPRGTKPGRNAKPLTKVVPEPNRDEATPRFCLRHLAPGYDVAALDRNARAALAMTLAQRAQLTWREIKQADRHGAGTEMIPAGQIKPTIPRHFSDADRFMVFRYHGKLPMVGVRAGDTFHILWLEAQFNDVYRHGK